METVQITRAGPFRLDKETSRDSTVYTLLTEESVEIYEDKRDAARALEELREDLGKVEEALA
jgi:hypothetical protein